MWASFRTATWLGWQIESNWASPALFTLYSIVKPLTSAAILVVIFGIVTKGHFESPAFSYMYLGNAFYMYVGAVMAGMAQAVVDDRERFRTLKSMYVAPVSIPMYLVGRGVARFITTTLSVIVTLAAGMAFLQLQIDASNVRWMLFMVALLIGLVMLATLGMMLASVVLTIVHGSWFVGEAVAAALYLFCGVVFPIDALPGWLRVVGYAIPVTYWLELVRRSLLGQAADQYGALARVGDGQLLFILIASTAGLWAIAAGLFWRCDYIARERGLIDRTTNY